MLNQKMSWTMSSQIPLLLYMTYSYDIGLHSIKPKKTNLSLCVCVLERERKSVLPSFFYKTIPFPHFSYYSFLEIILFCFSCTGHSPIIVFFIFGVLVCFLSLSVSVYVCLSVCLCEMFFLGFPTFYRFTKYS